MVDPIFDLISQEQSRQQNTLGLIPSENIASKAVRQAVGSVLTNKYSEGQAHARYYQGNNYIDQIETECKSRALKAFGLNESDWGVNVQALSGSPANLAVYNALLEPGDKVLSMYLPDGGHLSHGWQLPNKKISFTSKIWQFDYYHVDPTTKLFDYDQIETQAKTFKPKLIISGGTAYPRNIDHQRLSAIAKSVGAYYMADVAHEAGLIVGSAHPSPFPHADVVTMTTHKTLRGPRGALIFSKKDLSQAIDFSVFPGLQGGPHNHTIAGIAVALGEALTDDFKTYAHQVVTNAQTLGQVLIDGGLDVLTGGTDKHLLLVDLRSINQSGWIVAWALEAAGIIANRNTVPSETASPFYPSGLRLGTPLITTRGMKQKEMELIGKWVLDVVKISDHWHLPEDKQARTTFIDKFIKDIWQEPQLLEIKKQVEELCSRFPIA